MSALNDTRLLYLCRIYDTKGQNLHNLLERIQDNPHLFDTGEFKKRFKNKELVEIYAAYPRKPDPNDLARDLVSASEKNPIVKKLIVWRNNFVAHRNPKLSLERENILDKCPISKSELKELLDRAEDILNRYSNLIPRVEMGNGSVH